MMEERIYTYRFRLYPNVEQKVYLAQVFGCCRKVYNHFLDIKTKQYEQTKTSDSYAVQQSELTKLRKEDEFSYMSVIPLQSLQCSLQNLHNVFKRLYTSARNVDYSRGGVMKPNERPESVSGCSDTREAMSGNGRQA